MQRLLFMLTLTFDGDGIFNFNPATTTRRRRLTTTVSAQDHCGDWGAWSECTATCGKGFQHRNMTCEHEIGERNAGDVNGTTAAVGTDAGDTDTDGIITEKNVHREYQLCGTQDCPMPCIGTWTTWNTCPATCILDIAQNVNRTPNVTR